MIAELAGLAGSLTSGVFGGSGGAMPGDALKGPNINFGSVNFKSAGAGDRGKSAGDVTPAAADSLAAVATSPDPVQARASASGMPPWLPWAGIAAAVALAAVLFFRRR